jgi:tetratricopeptide (TPR) repeat protein
VWLADGESVLLEWFNVREAVAVGTALADQYESGAVSRVARRGGGKGTKNAKTTALEDFLQRADLQVRTLRLNVYKRAKLANSFKWRLLEKGIEKDVADEVTQALVLHLMMGQSVTGSVAEPVKNSLRAATSAGAPTSNGVTVAGAGDGTAKQLLKSGNESFASGAFDEALSSYQSLLLLKPRNADALNNVGATLCKLGRYRDAELYFRNAIERRPNYAEAHSNLGAVLRAKGRFAEAETALRRALQLKPDYVDARTLLGLALAFQGRFRDASAQFEKALKLSPRHVPALLGMAYVATTEGRFDEAEALFARAVEIDPRSAGALAGRAGLRKLTAADANWFKVAEEIAGSPIVPEEEAALRFAMGKYCDDVGDYRRAFKNYERANQLMKSCADEFHPEVHAQFVDDVIGVYTPDVIAQLRNDAAASTKAVLVTGMPRSGTSLVEQILASHPAVKGAGELGFWSRAGQRYEAEIRRAPLVVSTRQQLAAGYTRLLESFGAEAARVVDKDPVNSDFLGVIYSALPQVRVIYVQRDPIDTCLSCYFQQFSQALSFTFDLSDLAQYYREHQRLMAHWRKVLPAGTILDVPYEELVADQQLWTRRMLEFIGLDWDERCMDFHKTERPIATASYWQARQKIYNSSVQRWRRYEKFIGPLLSLRKLDA